MRAVLVMVGLAAALGLATAPPAAAFVELEGSFVADAECPATTSIRRASNPARVFTEAGRSYEVLGLNKEGGDFVQLVVPEVNPSARWVPLGCGSLEAVILPDEPDPVQPGRGFAPFFDDVAMSPRDPSPPPPSLSPFDQAVLEVCGPWGSRPSERAFRAMLDAAAVEPEVEAIRTRLDSRIDDTQVDEAAFKDRLTEIWFGEEGFAHIFCGEPDPRTIGGLHFRGRYLELQGSGEAGLMPLAQCDRAEIVPPIYTIGVLYRLPGETRERRACVKGYALDMDAADLFVEATQGFRASRDVSGKAMCLEPVTETDADFLAVFVIKNRAIRTFYPDASPSCDGGAAASSCICEEAG